MDLNETTGPRDRLLATARDLRDLADRIEWCDDTPLLEEIAEDTQSVAERLRALC